MSKNLFRSLIYLVTIFLSVSAIAVECRWTSMLGGELMHFDSDLSTNKVLSKNQVQEDLECLKIIFNNYYMAQEIFKDIPFIKRIENKIIHAEESSSLSFLDDIYDIHTGATDLHISYSIRNTGDYRSFYKKRNTTVEINKDYNSEEIIKTSNYIYFKPGDLRDQLTDKQSELVEYINQNDPNLILDMRDNPGGDDDFADQLVEAIFTPSQEIPKSYRYEVDSLFKSMGMCISLLMHEYYSAQDFCDDTKKNVENVPFKILVQYKIRKTTEELYGHRKVNYQSQIAILINSNCASACETTVEKLSTHPQVTIYGKNTAGALHFSNAITIMLPNSGIIAKIPTLLHKYDNDAPEGIGYSPDVDTQYIDLDSLFRD